MPDNFNMNVHRTPAPVSPGPAGSATVTVPSGSTVFYAQTPAVSATRNDGSLTAGQSVTLTSPAWVVSAGTSSVSISISVGGATAKPVVAGAKGGNAALGSLLGVLAANGIVTDQSSA